MMNDEQIIQDIYGYIGMALSWAMKRRQREREPQQDSIDGGGTANG